MPEGANTHNFKNFQNKHSGQKRPWYHPEHFEWPRSLWMWAEILFFTKLKTLSAASDSTSPETAAQAKQASTYTHLRGPVTLLLWIHKLMFPEAPKQSRSLVSNLYCLHRHPLRLTELLQVPYKSDIVVVLSSLLYCLIRNRVCRGVLL